MAGAAVVRLLPGEIPFARAVAVASAVALTVSVPVAYRAAARLVDSKADAFASPSRDEARKRCLVEPGLSIGESAEFLERTLPQGARYRLFSRADYIENAAEMCIAFVLLPRTRVSEGEDWVVFLGEVPREWRARAEAAGERLHRYDDDIAALEVGDAR